MPAIAVHAAANGDNSAAHTRAPQAINKSLPAANPTTKQAALIAKTVVTPARLRRAGAGLPALPAGTGLTGIGGATTGVPVFAAAEGAATAAATFPSRTAFSISWTDGRGPAGATPAFGAALAGAAAAAGAAGVAGAGAAAAGAAAAGFAPPARIAAMISLVDVGLGPAGLEVAGAVTGAGAGADATGSAGGAAGAGAEVSGAGAPAAAAAF